MPPLQVRAAYAAKYPEEYAEYESITTGKLPSDWDAKLPKFTSKGASCRKTGRELVVLWVRRMRPGGSRPLTGGTLRPTPALLTAPPPLQTAAWPPACTARRC